MAMMSSPFANLDCQLYASAFSGEAVFAVNTADNEKYEGVAPKHEVWPQDSLSDKPTKGKVKVRIVENGGPRAYVLMPDGEAIHVLASALTD
jgi:hypothetical protein